MEDDRRGVALTIKSCLESLMIDAERYDLEDLRRFLGLAALAADDAAGPREARRASPGTFTSPEFGHC